jgi:hypothetical protein
VKVSRLIPTSLPRSLIGVVNRPRLPFFPLILALGRSVTVASPLSALVRATPRPWLDEGGVRGGEGVRRNSLSFEAAADGTAGRAGKFLPNGEGGQDPPFVMSEPGVEGAKVEGRFSSVMDKAGKEEMSMKALSMHCECNLRVAGKFFSMSPPWRGAPFEGKRSSFYGR